MIYSKEVSEKVDLVNEVLDEIKAPHLLENPDFSVDEMSMESWLKLNLNEGGHKKNSTKFNVYKNRLGN